MFKREDKNNKKHANRPQSHNDVTVFPTQFDERDHNEKTEIEVKTYDYRQAFKRNSTFFGGSFEDE